MEYETSRPGTFYKTKEGLISTWTNTDKGARFFKKADESREAWQNKLYLKKALFNDCDISGGF